MAIKISNNHKYQWLLYFCLRVLSKGFKADTTQVTRMSARPRTTGADLNLNKATNKSLIAMKMQHWKIS